MKIYDRKILVEINIYCGLKAFRQQNNTVFLCILYKIARNKS